MSSNNLLSRISIDPAIAFGKPCIKRHCIWVALVLDYLAGGATVEEVLQVYPSIEREDVYACIAYGQKWRGVVGQMFPSIAPRKPFYETEIG